jgi:hypothetical protein
MGWAGGLHIPMGFDANSEGQPLVNVHKKTTQVNLWMVVGVAVFFIITAAVVIGLRNYHGPDDPPVPPEQQAQP